MISEDLRKQALDFEFHWVTENGDPAKITSGATMQATVCRAAQPHYYACEADVP